MGLTHRERYRGSVVGWRSRIEVAGWIGFVGEWAASKDHREDRLEDCRSEGKMD